MENITECKVKDTIIEVLIEHEENYANFVFPQRLSAPSAEDSAVRARQATNSL